MNSRKPKDPKSVSGENVVGLVLVCVALAAILIAARKPSAQPIPVAVSAAEPSATAAGQPPAKAWKVPVTQARARTTATSMTPPADGTLATLGPGSPAMISPTTEVSPNMIAQQSAPVTITGCLQNDDDTFWLKETDGVNTPKSRSWKSGFLKKGSASIEVLDPPNRLKLLSYVGQRIRVTGMLTDREMHGRSVQSVSASCN